MDRPLQFLFFSAGLGGIVLSSILFFSQKFVYKNLFLSLCILCLCISSLYNFFYFEGLLKNIPFLFIINKACSFLIAPSAYLYVRNIFDNKKTFTQTDWVHFLPFFLVVIIFCNIAIQYPFAIQKAINNNIFDWVSAIPNFKFYFFLSGLKYALWLYYIVLQSICIINFERKKASNYQYNFKLINWVKIFNITFIMLFLLLVTQRAYKFSAININMDLVNDITMAFTMVITMFFLITKPYILYHLEDSWISTINDKIVATMNGESNMPINAVVKPLYSSEKKDEYLSILNDILTEERPYLNKGITVKDLAKKTGIPAHHLSYLINFEFNLHFQDFINLKRIEYLKSKIGDQSWEHLTLEGICWEIGFTSRTTFFRAFIKLTGVSPSEYFRSIKKEHSA